MPLKQDTPFGQVAAYVEGLETEVETHKAKINELNAQITTMENRAVQPWEAKANTIISIAKALQALDIQYAFGGESRNGMDCSGFTQFLFKQVGYNLPRVSDDQSEIGTDVDYKSLRPGDLIFYDFNKDGKITHVSICIGEGKMIHTNTEATDINVQSTYWNYDSIVKIKRIIK